MNYCSYCGASLVDSAASFCAECGKKLNNSGEPPIEKTLQNPPPRTIKRSPQNYTRKLVAGGQRTQRGQLSAKIFANKGKKPTGGDKKKHFTRGQSGKPPDEREKTINPMDIGYDGYYDDIIPDDNGQLKEHISSELVRRIAVVAVSTMIIVILSVVLMTLL